MKAIGASAAVTAMTAGALLALPASPASAYSCSPSGSKRYTTAGSRSHLCTGTDFSQFATWVRCVENNGNPYTTYGPLARSGETSTARCHEYAWLDQWGIAFVS